MPTQMTIVQRLKDRLQHAPTRHGQRVTYGQPCMKDTEYSILLHYPQNVFDIIQ